MGETFQDTTAFGSYRRSQEAYNDLMQTYFGGGIN
jgi:hypothetical protein